MNTYGWRIGAVGLAFLSVVLGAFIGWALNRLQEKAYKKHRKLPCQRHVWLRFPQLSIGSVDRSGQRNGGKTMVLDDRRHHFCYWQYDFCMGNQRTLDRAAYRCDDIDQWNLFHLSRR